MAAEVLGFGDDGNIAEAGISMATAAGRAHWQSVPQGKAGGRRGAKENVGVVAMVQLLADASPCFQKAIVGQYG